MEIAKKTRECFVADGQPPKEIEIFVESHAGSQDFDEVGGREGGRDRASSDPFPPPFLPFFQTTFLWTSHRREKEGRPADREKCFYEIAEIPFFLLLFFHIMQSVQGSPFFPYAESDPSLRSEM